MNLEALRRTSANFTHRVINTELSIQEIDVKKIEADPNQPRKEFDAELLAQLASSIKAQGLIQPIVLRKAETEGRYYIISGERRFRATMLNGSNTIKAIVRDKFNAEDIGYLQMAENMKRADLTVVEIAEFVCARTELGEKQADISEKLGLDKGQISKYCAWREMPECLKEAVKTKKLGSIQAAHALFKTWEEYPKETEEFLESKERISTSEAKKFDPKSWYVPTFSENTEGKIEETDENQESLNTSKLERESAISDIGATQYEDVGKEKVFAETNDSSGNDVFEGTETEEPLSVSEPEENAESEKSASAHERKNAAEDFDNDLSGSNKPVEIEKTVDGLLETSDEESRNYRKPLILCLIEGRDCELIYRRKSSDGFVVVKWEDGSEEEVPAEDVEINRIIEA